VDQKTWSGEKDSMLKKRRVCKNKKHKNKTIRVKDPIFLLE
jgi:hypothetical protein